ncbi:hypothetical protein G7B40_020125 [Aetokthonos hydrillicola Thurmond2011]|jgi:hypothetical protein|uniref:Uncharacterized protein n=2 Tax=Aetokthonos TaxID=1550243 RepID=A0AAP5M940_9CYAN|nr:hypothetical protein [Aetokthonos hydrillicola]MBW4588527.1 hypothetical protein [Aetokthonos hydrillicola CCALA 1050]MDR9896855.1 hypothetical protein [Aetokthonos hydrillicola Thurmond2011]
MKIYAPNIHLFAFQLNKIVNSDSGQTKNTELWQKADEVVRNTLQQDLHLSQHLDLKKEPENRRVELLKDSEVKNDDYSVSFQGKVSLDHTQQVVIKGFAYPLRIYDSYGLWLNLRRPEKEDDDITPTEDVDVSLLSKLNFNNCLTLNHDDLFLGQTLLITAWLTGAKYKNSTNQVAEECLKALFRDPSQRPPFNRQEELFGSPIFEYGLFSQSSKYQHVLIWLFTDERADAKFNECYQDLVDLFFFRAKVVKAFENSRILYHELESVYKEVEQVVDRLPKNSDAKDLKTEDLKKFKKELKALPKLSLKYTRLLHLIEEYQNTIIINSDNYSSRVRRISYITGEDLRFLKPLSEENSVFFQKQITSDLGYFKHGLALLEQVITVIRGLVEIEQTERDRSLEQTIQILGVGLGAGAIVSGVVATHIEKPFAPLSFDKPFHPITSSLFWSFLAVLFFGGLTWLWTKRPHPFGEVKSQKSKVKSL